MVMSPWLFSSALPSANLLSLQWPGFVHPGLTQPPYPVELFTHFFPVFPPPRSLLRLKFLLVVCGVAVFFSTPLLLSSSADNPPLFSNRRSFGWCLRHIPLSANNHSLRVLSARLSSPVDFNAAFDSKVSPFFASLTFFLFEFRRPRIRKLPKRDFPFLSLTQGFDDNGSTAWFPRIPVSHVFLRLPHFFNFLQDSQLLPEY